MPWLRVWLESQLIFIFYINKKVKELKLPKYKLKTQQKYMIWYLTLYIAFKFQLYYQQHCIVQNCGK